MRIVAGKMRVSNVTSGIFGRAFRWAVAHWRTIIIVVVLTPAAFLVADFAFFDLIAFALLLLFIASQLFWIARVVDLGERFIPGTPRRAWIAIITILLYAFIIIHSYPDTIGQTHIFRPADYRVHSIVIEAAFWWWFVGSMLGFLIVIAFAAVDRAARGTAWVFRRARQMRPDYGATLHPPSSARRRFLEQAALVISATPFAAAGYGLLYGRQDLEVVRQRIRLARLPATFEAFRIAHLSDIHFGPFTSGDYIRHCISTTNDLKPDLILLTGDYIEWDVEAESHVVRVLAGLRAPHGVFGCLGNHEQEGGIEASITRSFAAHGIRILRQERTAIRLGHETLNLIGMDESHGQSTAEWKQDVHRRLQEVKALVLPDTVNILLVHYPAVFDYVTGLGVDLALAGHTHGGQLSLDFLSRGLNPSRLVTKYTNGWYERSGTQLYVNRGIGTTGCPIRLGARPEITVLELARA